MIRALAILAWNIPSYTINMITPLRHLEGQGLVSLTVFLEQEVRPSHIRAADVIVTGRNMDPAYAPIYQYALAHGIPIVSELDDNLFDVQEAHTRALYHDPKRQAHLRWMLGISAHVRIYSPALMPVVTPYNTQITLVRPAIHWALVPPALPLLAQPLTLVYATSRTQKDNLFPLILDDVREVLDMLGDRVRLVLLGYQPPELRRYANVQYVPFDSDFETFFRRFTAYGYAIGLAPMRDEPFYQGKTNLKFRDYAAAGAAGIYSDCTLYRGAGGVIDGETGLLVPNMRGAWKAAILRLIDDPALLETIRVNARAAAQELYDMDTAANGWLEHLKIAVRAEKRDGLPTSETIDSFARAEQNDGWYFTREALPETHRVQRARAAYHNAIPMMWRLHFRDFRLLIRRLLKRA